MILVGELANLTTKIITLLEFFNFVSEVSRLQYEWLSDGGCIWKSFGVNVCLQWKMYFHFIGEVFCTVFSQICGGYFDCTCTLAPSISLRRDRIWILFLYEKVVYVHYGDIMCHECWAVNRNGHVCNKYLILIHPPTISYSWARILQK
jgi:hypothetical protein